MITLALAGNPNVGKSTVFNALTGAHQHTGNWAGKTVDLAHGFFKSGDMRIKLVDLPGTYSLLAKSADEKTARDYICFGDSDGIIIVCDATCIERNLILALQTLEITGRVIIGLNLMDEAKKKKINVDTDALSRELGVRVIPMSARSGKGIDELRASAGEIGDREPLFIDYGEKIEYAINIVSEVIEERLCCGLNSRWLALRLLEGDKGLLSGLTDYLGYNITAFDEVAGALKNAHDFLRKNGISSENLRSATVKAVIDKTDKIKSAVIKEKGSFNKDRRLDKIFTGKVFAVPIMLLLLLGIMYLTAVGANYPSALLTSMFGYLETVLYDFLEKIGVGGFLRDMLANGMFRVLGWVIAVMLPPMAIFFPLFTLLEDFGYLPRIAFNMDCVFRKCGACGKQALTTCMGFGCNAVGVTGCRIIDSPREKIMAMLTNCFVPCNGRLPALIAVISMFFAASGGLKALMLTGTIVFGIAVTFAVCALLNKTFLKGLPSSFALELPPYRRPQLLKVIVRSVLDRTIYVLGRAAAVAAPAGIVIWLLANVHVGDATVLSLVSGFLDPMGRLMGMDGVILLGFVLGFPANEIVLPIIMMCYTSGRILTDYESLGSLREILTANGWSGITALCFIIFTICHFPCSTTVLTIYKESRSKKWTFWSVVLPTAVGIVLCIAVNMFFKIFL